MGPADSPLLISRADTDRSLSRSGTRRKQPSAPAAADCSSLTRFPLASQCSRYLLQTHGPRPGRSPLGNLPLLLGRHHRLRRYLGGASRPPPPRLRASQTYATQARRRQMYLRSQGGQLPRPSSHRRRPPTRSLSASHHQRDQSPQRMPRKFALFWVSSGTTGITLKTSQPSPDHYMR